jgi:hypothetical protein
VYNLFAKAKKGGTKKVKKNILQKQKKHQNIIPKEEFTGKNLTQFGGVGLFRRFFERMDGEI